MKITQVELINQGHPTKMICWLPRSKHNYEPEEFVDNIGTHWKKIQ